MSKKIPVWTWRQAVAKTDVPTLTKALCWAIGNYLSDAGKGCWPSLETLHKDTGMGMRSITTHLANAVKAGLLIARRPRLANGTLGAYTSFHPRFPDHVILVSEISDESGGVEPDASGALGHEKPGALGSNPDAPDASQKNISTKEVSKRERRASAPSAPSDQFVLSADWTLPDGWRAWATKEGPDHVRLIDGESKKFKAHWRGKSRLCSAAEWEAEWQKWFLRTIERPAKHGAPVQSGRRPWDLGGATIRDTSESVPEMIARHQRTEAKRVTA